MTDQINSDLSEEEFIIQLNEQLVSIGASSAEQSFGIAIWLGTLPILIIVAILLALRLINLILAFFLIIIFFLIFLAATSVQASRARQNAINHAIRDKTIPYILAYRKVHPFDLESFASKARETLANEAPLLQAIDQMKEARESDPYDE